jgi:tRNA pseudouridine38-40 synthase
MRNLRLDICYDGTRYKGFQRQTTHDNTIQGKLEQALSRILQQPIEVSGSGRTDTGVHALNQVVSFHCETDMSCTEILTQLRRYLPEDIGIYSCKDASPRFHARLNAKGKTYRYRIWNSDLPCVFDRRYVAVIPESLNVEAMRRAATYLIGEHDFAAFCANKHMKKSTIRQIYDLQIQCVGQEVQISVRGNGFLYNMVRIIAGTLIEVGLAQRDADSIPALFDGQRSEAGFLAPAQGLCLMEVTY